MIKQFIKSPEMQDKYGFTEETFTPHLEGIINESLLDKGIEQPLTEDFEKAITERENKLKNMIGILAGYDGETIARTLNKEKDNEDVSFLYDKLTNGDIILSEIYYETLIFDGVKEIYGVAKEKQCEADYKTDRATIQRMLRDTLEEREQEYVKSFGLSEKCYSFTMANFSGTYLTFEGMVTPEDLLDDLCNDRMEVYVANGKVLCDYDEIGKETDVELDYYFLGNTELLDGEDSEPDCYPPNELLNAIDSYPGLFLQKYAEHFDSNTAHVNAGLLELQLRATHEPILYHKVTFENEETYYLPKKIEDVSELHDWSDILAERREGHKDISEVEKVRLESICISSCSGANAQVPDSRTLELIKAYENEPLIQEMTEQTYSDEWYEPLYIDCNDLFADFCEMGKEKHDSSPAWSDNALDDYVLKHYDKNNKFDADNICQIHLKEYGWKDRDEAIRIMSKNDLNSTDVDMMNIKVVDDNGNYHEKDVDAEAAYLIFRNTENQGGGNHLERVLYDDVLDLTRQGGRGR